MCVILHRFKQKVIEWGGRDRGDKKPWVQLVESLSATLWAFLLTVTKVPYDLLVK